MSENKFNVGDLVQHRASEMKGVVVRVLSGRLYDISIGFGVVQEYISECELEKCSPTAYNP